MLWPSQYECGPRLCRCRPWIEMVLEVVDLFECFYIHCDVCSDVFHAVDHDLRLFGTKCTSAFDLLVRSCSFPLLPPIRLMSSENRKLQIGLPPMEIVGTWS